jgi:O-antigen chain-terminating methyltransferase
LGRLSTVEDYITEVARRARSEPPTELTSVDDPAERRAGYLALAREHADIAAVPADTRLKPLKRMVARLTRHITHHQVVVNEQVLAALDTPVAAAPAAAPEPPAATMAAVVAALEVQLEHLQDEVDALRRENAHLRGDDPSAAYDDELYAAFEDRFRGSREEIKERLTVYVDELVAVATSLGAPVLDLGSGRGELLELLHEHDVEAYGVDESAAMVERAAALGLRVEHDDAMAHLGGLPDGHLAACTAMHLIEHLPPAEQVALVREARRVLRPGGLLILETPNSTTLLVGASTFYLDPSHQRPVHPLYLEFLVEHLGFTDVEIRELNAPPDELRIGPADASLPAQVVAAIDAVDRVNAGPRDYAVVGRRPGA